LRRITQPLPGSIMIRGCEGTVAPPWEWYYVGKGLWYRHGAIDVLVPLCPTLDPIRQPRDQNLRLGKTLYAIEGTLKLFTTQWKQL
jgi:hypothetical protein